MKFWPERPEVHDERAQWFLDWVQTVAYTFWVLFIASASIIALAEGFGAADIAHLIQTLH